MLKRIAVADLVPGMMVTQVLKQSGPVKIRKVGFIRSTDMIKGLSEMGVQEVEIDAAQSFSVENTENIQAKGADTPVTATQCLVASEKQVADVDRQLSQQFHRSLFLPAVEQMPSKWALYGKPYSILSVLLLLGVSCGWFAVSIPLSYFTDRNPQVIEVAKQEATVNESDDSATFMSKPDHELSNSGAAEAVKSADNNDKALQSDVFATINENTKESTNVIKSSDENANDRPTTATNLPTVASESSPEQDDKQPEVAEVNTFKGVVIEDGQQILGYQAPTDTTLQEASPSRSISNSPTTFSNSSPTSTTPTDDELMARLQQAIQEVDNLTLQEHSAQEPAEILTVTDLNQLPRIDQLSAATLTLMPAMSFSTHMYAANRDDRWVRVNGRRLGEGEAIADDLILETIEPDYIVLAFRGERFTMNALSDW